MILPNSSQLALAEVSRHHSSWTDRVGKVPRVVTVVPLNPSVSTERFFVQFVQSLCLPEEEVEALTARYEPHSSILVPAPRFKAHVLVNIIPALDLYASLDAALVSDVVVLLMSSSDEVQTEGETILRSLQGQAGNVTVMPCVQVRANWSCFR